MGRGTRTRVVIRVRERRERGAKMTVSAVGETKAEGTGKPGDRKNYAGLLMSPAPCLLCFGR